MLSHSTQWYDPSFFVALLFYLKLLHFYGTSKWFPFWTRLREAIRPLLSLVQKLKILLPQTCQGILHMLGWPLFVKRYVEFRSRELVRAEASCIYIFPSVAITWIAFLDNNWATYNFSSANSSYQTSSACSLCWDFSLMTVPSFQKMLMRHFSQPFFPPFFFIIKC